MIVRDKERTVLGFLPGELVQLGNLNLPQHVSLISHGVRHVHTQTPVGLWSSGSFSTLRGPTVQGGCKRGGDRSQALLAAIVKRRTQEAKGLSGGMITGTTEVHQRLLSQFAADR